MNVSLSEMPHDSLIQYKLKMHHLHRDIRHACDTVKDADRINTLYKRLDMVDRILAAVYSEFERRKPGVK
jgi:hypothetical protein